MTVETPTFVTQEVSVVSDGGTDTVQVLMRLTGYSSSTFNSTMKTGFISALTNTLQSTLLTLSTSDITINEVADSRRNPVVTISISIGPLSAADAVSVKTALESLDTSAFVTRLVSTGLTAATHVSVLSVSIQASYLSASPQQNNDDIDSALKTFWVVFIVFTVMAILLAAMVGGLLYCKKADPKKSKVDPVTPADEENGWAAAVPNSIWQPSQHSEDVPRVPTVLPPLRAPAEPVNIRGLGMVQLQPIAPIPQPEPMQTSAPSSPQLGGTPVETLTPEACTSEKLNVSDMEEAAPEAEQPTSQDDVGDGVARPSCDTPEILRARPSCDTPDALKG